MVLSAGQMQRVGCPQSKAGTQLRGLQIHRLGHGQRHENPEQLDISAFQDRIAALDRPHQAFAFHQR
jgi:hypothetical protein